MIILLTVNFYGFSDSFYAEKFKEYNVQEDVGNAWLLHEDLMDFVQGKNDEVPKGFNERETKHLWDVRRIISTFKTVLNILIFSFVLLLVISSALLKDDSQIISFTGKVLLFGGTLTLALAVILFLLISSYFASTFESFHTLLFEKGTYLFDPAEEMIVRLYPEQLFEDLGAKISKGVIFASVAATASGFALTLKSKSKKNKNRRK